MSLWTSESQLLNTFADTGSVSGFSVSISDDGNLLAVGTPYRDVTSVEDNRGGAYLYTRTGGAGTSWGASPAYSLLNTAGLPEDHAGFKVALSGNGNVLAVSLVEKGGNTGGKVNIYEKANDGTWSSTPTRQLTIDANVNGDDVGISLSFSSDGTLLAVGLPFASAVEGANDAKGCVYVYERANGTWGSLPTLTKILNNTASLSSSNNQNAGLSVCISGNGNVLAVGIPGVSSGCFRIYTKTNGIWNQVFQTGQFISNADDSLGYSISLSSDGSIVAVGAPYRENDDKGGVFVFEKASPTSWIKPKTITLANTSGAANDLAGISVSLSGSGNSLAVGVRFKSSTSVSGGGGVYLYEKINGTWGTTPSHQLLNTNGNSGDSLGFSVSLSADGSVLAAGIPFKDTIEPSDDRGGVYVYKKSSPAAIPSGDPTAAATVVQQTWETALATSTASGLANISFNISNQMNSKPPADQIAVNNASAAAVGTISGVDSTQLVASALIVSQVHQVATPIIRSKIIYPTFDVDKKGTVNVGNFSATSITKVSIPEGCTLTLTEDGITTINIQRVSAGAYVYQPSGQNVNLDDIIQVGTKYLQIYGFGSLLFAPPSALELIPPCFGKGTKILCDDKGTYKKVKDLKEGDLVLTASPSPSPSADYSSKKYKRIYKIVKGEFKYDVENFKTCMYSYVKTKEEDSFLLTGRHGVFVECLEDHPLCNPKNALKYGDGHLIPAGAHSDFVRLESSPDNEDTPLPGKTESSCTFYHICLENENEDDFDLIFASEKNVLVETLSKRYFKEETF